MFISAYIYALFASHSPHDGDVVCTPVLMGLAAAAAARLLEEAPRLLAAAASASAAVAAVGPCAAAGDAGRGAAA